MLCCVVFVLWCVMLLWCGVLVFVLWYFRAVVCYVVVVSCGVFFAVLCYVVVVSLPSPFPLPVCEESCGGVSWVF